MKRMQYNSFFLIKINKCLHKNKEKKEKKMLLQFSFHALYGWVFLSTSVEAGHVSPPVVVGPGICWLYVF